MFTESLSLVVQWLCDSRQGQQKVVSVSYILDTPQISPPVHGHPASRGQLFPKLRAGNVMSTLNSYIEKQPRVHP